jgi:hypothetical protein
MVFADQVFYPIFVEILLNGGRFQDTLAGRPPRARGGDQNPPDASPMASMHPVASRLDTIQRRSVNSACEAPAEEKLFCSCSSLSASVALMMQPRGLVTAIETATAADLCYLCVRCVSFHSHELESCDFDVFCHRECDCIRFGELLRGAARSALAAEGRRSEFFFRRTYLTSQRRRSRCATPRRRPANESTCRRVESSSFRRGAIGN